VSSHGQNLCGSSVFVFIACFTVFAKQHQNFALTNWKSGGQYIANPLCLLRHVYIFRLMITPYYTKSYRFLIWHCNLYAIAVLVLDMRLLLTKYVLIYGSISKICVCIQNAQRLAVDAALGAPHILRLHITCHSVVLYVSSSISPKTSHYLQILAPLEMCYVPSSDWFCMGAKPGLWQ
jgi:hypothetical protein